MNQAEYRIHAPDAQTAQGLALALARRDGFRVKTIRSVRMAADGDWRVTLAVGPPPR